MRTPLAARSRAPIGPTASCWLLLFALCGASCSGWTSQRVPEDPRPLLKAAGESPSVAVILSGGANERQQKTCQDTVSRLGVPSPNDPDVTATLDLSGDDLKTLVVTSKKKGQVLKQERPSWWLEDLCADALSAGLRAWGAENGKALPPPPQENQPRPKLAQRADPPSDEDRPVRRRRQDAGKDPSQKAPPAAKKGNQDPWGDL